MNYHLVNYTYLQVLDLLTTVAFLATGVREANPIARAAMQLSNSPLTGLVCLKILAVGLGFYCWKLGKERILKRGNVLFAFLIVWNLVAIITGRFDS